MNLTPPQLLYFKLLAWALVIIAVVLGVMYVRKRLNDANTAEAAIEQRDDTAQATTEKY